MHILHEETLEGYIEKPIRGELSLPTRVGEHGELGGRSRVGRDYSLYTFSSRLDF